MVRVVRRPWVPSARNLEVLAAVCALGSRKYAAAGLGLSPRTVGQHMRLLAAGSHAVSDSQLCWIYRDRIAPHIVGNGPAEAVPAVAPVELVNGGDPVEPNGE